MESEAGMEAQLVLSQDCLLTSMTNILPLACVERVCVDLLFQPLLAVMGWPDHRLCWSLTLFMWSFMSTLNWFKGAYHHFGRREIGQKTPLGRREKAKKGQNNSGRREKGKQFWEKGEEVCNEYYALVDVGNATWYMYVKIFRRYAPFHSFYPKCKVI